MASTEKTHFGKNRIDPSVLQVTRGTVEACELVPLNIQLQERDPIKVQSLRYVVEGIGTDIDNWAILDTESVKIVPEVHPHSVSTGDLKFKPLCDELYRRGHP